MTFDEAKTIFLNRGYVEVDGGSYFDGNKWRESVIVISEWLKEEPFTKTGHWIYGEDSVECHDGWFCSKCGHFEFWDYSFDSEVAKLHLPNFCPDCGAKMVEPQESEDK